MPAALLPSAPCSLKHAVLAPARKPLRIFGHMLSVSMNYFIPGSRHLKSGHLSFYEYTP